MKEVVFKVRECEDRVRELGPDAPTDSKSKTQLLWNMITDFCETYKNTIRGKFDRRRNTKAVKDLSGGTSIREFFSKLLIDFTGNFTATEDYSD